MAKKILLADDSITIQKVVELTFSDGDFEVVAVNNGARAIQQLQESRPDIILSDIIMPEKNGYEVCEFVKSHPDYRTIPVVLLTGTFEPFDPDRAERAGCDAVVTKPFESQSLIHKVEELIAAAGPAKAPVPEASPFDETAVGGRHSREMMFEPPPAAEPAETSELPGSGFSPADESPADASNEGAEPFAETERRAPEEIFGLSSDASPSAVRDPFDETGPPFPSSSQEPSWPPSDSADARQESSSPLSENAFDLPSPSLPEAGFGDLSDGDEESASAEPAPPEPSGGEQVWSAATTAFPKMSFDDLRKAAEQNQAAPAPAEPESPAWPSQSADGFHEAEQDPQPEADESVWGGETTAIPKMSFGDLPGVSGEKRTDPAPEAEGSAWSAETTAIPKMSFDDLQRSQEPEPPAEAASLPWETSSTSEPVDEAPAWPAPADEPRDEQSSAPGGFGFDSPTPPEETIPFEPPPAEEKEEAWPAASIEEETPVADDSSFAAPVGASFEGAAEPEAAEQEPQVAAAASSGGSLSEADVDRIARRVVELLSDSTVREIAWEVIPDVANAIVRDRIRELEAAD